MYPAAAMGIRKTTMVLTNVPLVDDAGGLRFTLLSLSINNILTGWSECTKIGDNAC